MIVDLSWPLGQSVNSYISDDSASVDYISIDTVVQRVKHHGLGCLMAKLDLEHAYKHIVVRPKDWDLLGATISPTDDPTLNSTSYYVDCVEAQIFNKYATGLEFIMRQNGVSCVEHYLNDFFTCGDALSTECAANLQQMLLTCADLGFSVQATKVQGPTTELEFLGIVVDSVKMELCISKERLSDIISDLREFQGKRSCRKRDLLSLS